MSEYTPLLRPHVFSSLSAATTLTVVHGGRFSGKTTLIRTWLAAHPPPGRTTVFVEKPGATTTPEAYWTNVLRAVGTAFGIDAPPAGAQTLDAVCTAVRAVQDRILLILDGVEGLRGGEGDVENLLARSPRSRVVVTTRTLGRWADLVADRPDRVLLSSPALAFTPDDTAEYLHASALLLDPHTVHWIVHRTDGLPGLVDAVRASLQATHTRPTTDSGRLDDMIDDALDRALARALGNDPAVATVRREILMSSVLGSPTVASAAALPDLVDAEAFLKTLELCGLVECTLDTTEEPWHYPEPVRKSLRRLAEYEDPVALRRAGTTLIEHWLRCGKPHAALEDAIELQDWHCALHIASQHWTTLYTQGFLETMGKSLVERIPAELADHDPTIAAIRRLHRQMAAPRDVPAVAAEPGTITDITPGPAAVVMRAITLRLAGQFSEAADVCDAGLIDPIPLLDELDDATRHAYAFFHLHVGITYLLADRMDDAIAMFRRAHTAGVGTFVERDAAGKLALVHALRGACADARTWIEAERSHPPLQPDAEELVRPAGLVAAALVALDRLDPDAALDILTHLGNPTDREELWAFVLYAQGQHALLTGIPADGLRHLDTETKRYLPVLGGLSASLIDSIRADLHLALGRIDQAREVAQHPPHLRTAPALARILLLGGDPSGAADLVDRFHADLDCTCRESMELAVIGAAASSALRHVSKARGHLRRAVTLSRMTGLVRPFALLPASLSRLVADLDVDLPVDLETTAATFVVFPVFTPLVTLSARERVVLDALVAGGTVASIAKSQFVSVNTVKTQLRSLYRKLGVHSAKDAIEAARNLPPDP